MIIETVAVNGLITIRLLSDQLINFTALNQTYCAVVEKLKNDRVFFAGKSTSRPKRQVLRH